jgi:hypothetical protein
MRSNDFARRLRLNVQTDKWRGLSHLSGSALFPPHHALLSTSYEVGIASGIEGAVDICVLIRLIIPLLLLAACSTAYADTIPVPETYTVYLYWNRSNYATVTYTDSSGFIDVPLSIPCSQLTDFRFTLGYRSVGCGTGVVFTPEDGGLAVQIFSRREGLSGGFFVTPDQDGTFTLRPGNPAYLIVSDPSASPRLSIVSSRSAIATAEPSALIFVLLGLSALFVVTTTRR